MTSYEKYNLYISILEKYNLSQFDERINNNAYCVVINCAFYSEFENIAKTVFDCVSELNQYDLQFDDFFIFTRECVNDEYNDCIVIRSAKHLIANVTSESEENLNEILHDWVQETHELYD